MPPLGSMIRDLNPSRSTWAVTIRVARKYYLRNREDFAYGLDFVVHDAEGSRIHISVPEKLIKKFAETLDEERLYVIKNFIVTNNNICYKTSNLTYKILLFHKTEIVQVWEENFPRHIFDFKSFADLASPNVDNSILVDVIGRISNCGTPFYKDVKGKETKLINFTLENVEGAKLSCTLFGNASDELVQFLEHNNVSVILILQLCRLNVYENEVRVTNTYNVSKVLMNANVPEVNVFHERMKSEGRVYIPIIPMNLPSVASVEQDLEFSRDKFRTLAQLSEMEEAGEFWVFGNVSAIEAQGDWCFVSCTKCFKKMFPIEESFVCYSCGNEDKVPNWRFMVKVRVTDGTGNAPLLLWDRDVHTLIGFSAAQMVRKHGVKSLPGELTNMVRLEAVFKVKIKIQEVGGPIIAFPVSKMTSDVQVIDKFFKVEKNNNVDISEGEIRTPILPTKLKAVQPSSILSVKRKLSDEFSDDDIVKKIQKVIGEAKK